MPLTPFVATALAVADAPANCCTAPCWKLTSTHPVDVSLAPVTRTFGKTVMLFLMLERDFVTATWALG